MKLIDEWKQAWRMFSVQAMAAGVALQGAYVAMPDTFQQLIPHEWMHYISIALLVLGLFGRLVQQSPKDPPQ
jgi:hypothetical protein